MPVRAGRLLEGACSARESDVNALLPEKTERIDVARYRAILDLSLKHPNDGLGMDAIVPQESPENLRMGPLLTVDCRWLKGFA